MNETISLEHAHRLLGTFGINRPTANYDRWVKDDGFDLDDFDEVLFESEFVLIHDWRGELEESLDQLSVSLGKLGPELEFEIDEDGVAATVACREQSAAVRYEPNAADDFDEVVRTLQRIVPESIEFRASPDNEGSDTFVYAVLGRDEWAEIEGYAGAAISRFFVPLDGL